MADDRMDIDLSLEELIERKKLETQSTHPAPSAPRGLKLPFLAFSRHRDVSNKVKKDLGQPLGELVKRDVDLPKIRQQKRCFKGKPYLYSRDDYPPERYGRVYGFQPPSHPRRSPVKPVIHPSNVTQSGTILIRPFPTNATHEQARDMFQSVVGPVKSLVLGSDWAEVAFHDAGDVDKAIKRFHGQFWKDTEQQITVTRAHHRPASKSYGITKRVSPAKRGAGRKKGASKGGMVQDQGYGRQLGAGQSGSPGQSRGQGRGRGVTGANTVPVNNSRQYGQS